MTNNDVLRRFRYALELDNLSLLACFGAANVELAPAELAALLKNDEEAGFAPLSDELLGLLLDGFVSLRRGKKPVSPGELEARPGASEQIVDARASTPSAPDLSNNRILRAIKIGLELKDVDILEIMELASTPISKTELSALFRREDHRNYQPCGNQFLRSFLKGLATWHRQQQQRRP